jgi:hypothetical protein
VVLLQDLHVNGTSQQALRNSSGITGYRSAEEYFKQSEEKEKKDRAGREKRMKASENYGCPLAPTEQAKELWTNLQGFL